MNICFVITNLAGGGAEKAVVTLADGLQRRGHTIQLILLEPRLDYEVPPGVALHVLPKLNRGLFGKRLTAMRLRRLYDELNEHRH